MPTPESDTTADRDGESFSGFIRAAGNKKFPKERIKTGKKAKSKAEGFSHTDNTHLHRASVSSSLGKLNAFLSEREFKKSNKPQDAVS